jgi:hypothetical protein
MRGAAWETAKIGLDARIAENSGISSYIRGLLANCSPEQKNRLLLLGNPEKLKIYGRPVIALNESI